jgi:adenylate kinase
VPVRADDKPDVLRSRLEAHREQIAPLVYYKDKGRNRMLRNADGLQPIEAESERLGRPHGAAG